LACLGASLNQVLPIAIVLDVYLVLWWQYRQHSRSGTIGISSSQDYSRLGHAHWN